jgi:geranylgeranyl diphosphate synthase type II
MSALKRPQTLERLARLVERALQQAVASVDGAPRVLHEALRYCVVSGGKRFRPLLCLGACEAVGGEARTALPAACAVELLHSYSLVHDDLPAMDNADQRRGQPTCHRKFGEGNAILVGDALLTLAFELLGRNGLSNSLAIIRMLGQACGGAGLIGGQVLDLQAISQPRMATERVLREIAERKTAALITASVVAGALVGGAAPQQVRWLARYGGDLGLAFQLLDDVHDREGLARAMGSDRACVEAQRLIARAVKRLEPFGARAQVLRQLAAWLATIVP